MTAVIRLSNVSRQRSALSRRPEPGRELEARFYCLSPFAETCLAKVHH